MKALHKFFLIFFFKILFIFKERKGEIKNQCVAASYVPPTRDPVRNPGMCPYWESSRLPLDFTGRHPIY